MGTGRLKVAASVTLALGMLAAFGANYRIDEKGNVHSVRTIAERVPIIAPVAPGVLRARPTFNSCGVCRIDMTLQKNGEDAVVKSGFHGLTPFRTLYR